MKAQYQVLADLRRIDEKVSRLRADVERIPAEIAKLNEALGKRKGEYDKAITACDALEKKLRDSESNLKDREDKLHKAEGKMMEVKTNEEYQAAIRENDAQKNEKSGLEEQAIKLLSEVEEQKKQLKEVEKGFRSYETIVNGDTAKLEEERARILRLLEEQIEKRNSTASQLSPDVALVYHRIASRISGVAVVPVENGMCSGCNMKMRPQLYNEILGFKTIHRCPSCGRILIIATKESDETSDKLSAS